jgi:hypothetical protein
VLPLLLTTSHHNLPDPDATPERKDSVNEDENKSRTDTASSFAFCSELILWQVSLMLFALDCLPLAIAFLPTDTEAF